MVPVDERAKEILVEYYALPGAIPADAPDDYEFELDEAACQCGGVPAVVEPPLRFGEVLEKVKCPLRVLADGSGALLKELEGDFGSAALMIGPEGGHSAREMEEAAEAGWLKVAFHPFIMRAETAAPVCAALLQQKFGEF